MRPKEWALVLAAIGAGGLLLISIAVPVVGQSNSFNLSRTLPTGSTYFNGNPNCGPNETVHLDYPANGMVSFWTIQNETDATVDIWITYAGFAPGGISGGYSFVSTGQGHGHGTLSSGDLIIVLKGCGPTPTVSLGFWGIANYSVPLL